MAEMPTRTTASKTLMDCPACHNPVVAHMAMDLHLGSIEPSMNADQAATVDATIRLVGLQITHDCTPKVTRNAHPERTTP